MSIKEFVDNLKVENYVYVVLPEKQICVELTDYEKAQAYAKAFGGYVSEIYPYAEYGYEDPYTFTDEWTILVNYGDTVHYEVNENGEVVEVVSNGSL
jgi:hypothetical protein